jgi:hypothetical protein
MLGVGVGGIRVGPDVALMTARSPSTKLGVLVIVALNESFTITLLPPFNVNVVGPRVPVSLASTGRGLFPPIGIGLPSKEIPSAERVKYEEPNVLLVLLEKSTRKLRLDRLTVVDTGHVVSGNIEELVPD